MVWRESCAAWRELVHWRRRDRCAGGTQWFGAFDACEGADGTRARARFGELSRSIDDRPTPIRDRTHGRRLRARTTRRFPDVKRAREPAAWHEAGRIALHHQRRGAAFPRVARTCEREGGDVVGRRTANARTCPDLDGRPIVRDRR